MTLDAAIDIAGLRLPHPGRSVDCEKVRLCRYRPLSTCLAIVANCIFDVPS
jgi:hypothetical protein